MAHDRFIYFSHNVPMKETIQVILEDYLGSAGHVTFESEDNRLFAVLTGKPSLPFKRIFSPSPEYQHMDRWFEVFLDLDDGLPNIDIVTRHADEYTNVVAEGFAELIAKHYNVRRDKR